MNYKCFNAPSTYVGIALILASCLSTLLQEDWVKGFKESIRHLTCWYVILASVYLTFVCVLPVQVAAILGIGLVSLSFVILFGRVSAIPHVDPKNKWAAPDIICHYIVPLTMVGFMLTGTMNIQHADSSALWKGLLVCIGILTLWFGITLVCIKCGLEWPYSHATTNPFHKDKKRWLRLALYIWIGVFSYILTALLATLIARSSVK